MLDLKVNHIQPIFLLGLPRSGTTLLRLLLNAHSRIAIPFESFVLIEYAARLNEYNNLKTLKDRHRLVNDLLASKGISQWKPPVLPQDIDLEKCTDYAETINQIYKTYALKCGKGIWGDKTPSYIYDIHILNKLFPESRFIHIIRDGRDVCLSQIRNRFGSYYFPDALRKWVEVISWSRKMGRLLPQHRYLEIRFEDLLVNPEKTLKQIMKFLQLPYENRMIEEYWNRASENLPSTSLNYHQNLNRPIDNSQAYKWKRILSHADQTLAYRIAGDLFEELDYPSGYKNTANSILLLRKSYLKIKAWMLWQMESTINIFRKNLSEK